MVSNTSPLVLIGGHGFLGTTFAAHAQGAGGEVHRVGRRALTNPGERDWNWDNADRLAAKMAGRAPVIVDFAYATVPSTSFGDPVEDFTANLGAVIRHLDFAKAIGACAYLFISSGGTVYGDAKHLPLAEDAPTHPISPYGITKLACENYALMYQRIGMPVMIARPSNIYGPAQVAGRGQGLIAAALTAARSGTPITLFGDGGQIRDYLYIEDFCDALEAVMKNGQDGDVYNIGSGIGVRADALLAAIGSWTERDGHPLEIVMAEARPFDVNANILNAAKLTSLSGWQPKVPLSLGVSRTWEWMLHQHPFNKG